MRKDDDYHIKRNYGIGKIDFIKASEIRRETVKEKYGVEYISQDISFRDKVKSTCLDKYGVENTLSLNHVTNQRNLSLLTEEVVEKRINGIKKSANKAKEVRRKTLLMKYGVESPSQIKGFREKVRETLKRKYGFCSCDEINRFITYRKEVVYLTSKVRKQLYNINDTCYYSGVRMTPSGCGNLSKTIDHKISIVYGFKNNISPKKLAEIDNLCVTCRLINIIKNYRTEEEFRNSPLFERALNAVK